MSVRYHFDNLSEDIKAIYCTSLGALGIHWTRPSYKDIAVYRKADTARLDEFVGPKPRSVAPNRLPVYASRSMEAISVRPGYELWRPNREKAQSKTTKAIVAFVLLVSAGLIAVIVLGGWERMQSSSIAVMSLVWAGLYVFMAFMVARWNRGLLPVASALAVIMAIFAAVAAPGWFARSKDGLDSPVLPEDLIGLLAVVLIFVQILLIVVAMIGFNQEWHVEEERPIGGAPLAGEDDEADLPPQGAAA